MRKILVFACVLALILLASACNSPAGDIIPSATSIFIAPSATLPPPATLPPSTSTPAPTAAPLPTPTQPPATPTLAQAPLTVDRLKNFTYQTPGFAQKSVKLVNGSYKGGSGIDFMEVRLLDPVVFGDLNSDAMEDAAVLLAINTGGSGTFKYVVVVLNLGGGPTQNGIALIEDRANIKSLTVTDRKIRAEGIFHGPQDGLCCPTLAAAKTFQFTLTGLTLVSFDTQTPDGKTRAIHINSPFQGSQASGQVVLKGSTTISPFENNLVYRIFDQAGQKLTEGPFTVQSDAVGGPAVFEAPVDLANMTLGQVIHLELLDLSAKDGSTLAMDSVDLMIK